MSSKVRKHLLCNVRSYKQLGCIMVYCIYYIFILYYIILYYYILYILYILWYMDIWYINPLNPGGNKWSYVLKQACN